MNFQPIPALLGLVLAFAALAKGAHDLWAATLVHLLVLFLFAALLFKKSRTGQTLRLKFGLSTAVLVVAWCVSFWRSINPGESFIALMDAASALVLFIIALNSYQDDGSENTLVNLMIPCLWAQAALIVFQFFRWGSLEMAGALINSNILAAFALFWIPPFLVRLKESTDQNPRLYAASGLVSCLIVLLGSRSVLAWALLFGAAGFYFFNNRRPALVAFLAVGALGLLWIKLRPSSASLDRIWWWETGGRMILHHPILGVGIGNFDSAFPAYKTGILQSTRFAHSSLVTVAAETGILGILAALSFFCQWLQGARRSFLSVPAARPYGAGVALFLAFTLVSIGFEIFANLLTLAVFMGIVTAKSEGGPALPSSGFRIPVRLSAAIVAAMIALAAMPELVSPFLASRHTVDGQSYWEKGNSKEADKHFKIAIELDERSWEPYHGRARVAYRAYQESKDTARLREAMEFQALALERNKLNPILQRELRMYSELAKSSLLN